MAILEALVRADEAKARRQQLALMNKELNANLIAKGYNPDTLDVIPGSAADVERAQNQQALQLAGTLQGKLAAQDTDQAIMDFSQTGDASYLQRAMDNNPYLKNAWQARGVQQVSNIDWQNDTNMLARMGFNPAEYDTPEKQDILKRNTYKFFDGQEWNIGMLNNVVRETGFLSRVGENRGQQVVDNFQQFRDFMSGPRSSPNTVEGHKYEREITAASEATGVPGNLIAAMMHAESTNNPNAVSPKNARGLMQLLEGTAREMGVTDITDPAQNIMGGAKYMAQMLQRYNGDLSLALAAYNAGTGNVTKYGGIPPFQETTKYVNQVTQGFEAGNSYYAQPGQTASQPGQASQQTQTTRSVGNPIGDANNQAKASNDARLNIIQGFVRDNANAAQGRTSQQVELAAQADMLRAQTAARANEVKLATDGQTAAQKDLAESRAQTSELLNKFGGEEQFYSTDFSSRENFNKAWPQVVAMTKLEGTNLTAEDKKAITDVRGLINMADPASNLSSSQIGLIDSYMSNVSKYVSEAGNGVDKAAAMASFRNILRHALYGATLSEGEIQSFNEAFGTNKQMLGPLMEQFKISLTQVQSRIDSIANLNNPYAMHVLVGADQTKLTNIRSALQERLDFIEGKTNATGGNVVPEGQRAPTAPRNITTTPAPTSQRRSLSDIFGGGQ